MAKLPAFQFYPGDWRKDPGVQALTYHERGVWFEMLCLMFESEERGVLLLNGRPMPEAALARLLGLNLDGLTGGLTPGLSQDLTPTLSTTLTTLLTYGVMSKRDSDGAFYCRRMVRDEEKRQEAKNNGSKGGNPVLISGSDKGGVNPPVNPQANPPLIQKQGSSSSSSTSVSSSTAPSISVANARFQEIQDPDPSSDGAHSAPAEADGVPVEALPSNGLTVKQRSYVDGVQSIVDEWRIYHPKATPRLEPKSKEFRAIVARFKERQNWHELRLAVHGMHKSPHHLGENERGTEYLSLDLCFRSADHVTKFIELAEKTKKSKTEESFEKFADEIREDAELLRKIRGTKSCPPTSKTVLQLPSA